MLSERQLEDNDKFLDDVRRLGYSRVEVEFDGESDNGCVLDPVAVRGDDYCDLSEQHQAVFKNIVWSFLTMKKPGWMDGDGSSGVVTFDISLGRFSCRLLERHVTYKKKSFQGHILLPRKDRLCTITPFSTVSKARLKKKK